MDVPNDEQRSEGIGFARADAPIERRSQDRLHRAPMADAIAEQVVAGPAHQGLVIGVVGRWGNGKTSVLKMVEEAVRNRSPGTPILHFNPWLFAGSEELVSRFLQELGAQLRDEGKRRRLEGLTNAGDSLMSYAESLEPLGWVPIVGPWLARVGSGGRLLKKVQEARQAQPSAEKKRDEIRDQLKGLDRRVVVVIDDLDRVDREQIRDMVRLVKLVGDFPNTTYLISYDRVPVERALGADSDEGRAYLEKIVQVVHDLPEPSPEAVLRIFLEELQGIVDAIPHGPFRSEDWQNVLPDGIRPFFQTVRDVRRYLNSVPVSLRVTGGEVALVDCLALEAIRVFAPQAYDRLPAAIDVLTGEERSISLGRSDREEADRAQVERILEAAGEYRDPTRVILRRLFPSAGHLLGGSRFVGDEQRARRGLRVASADIFRTYVHRNLPEGVVSGALVQEAVETLGDRHRLQRLFERLDADTAEGLIQRLEDYEHEFDPRVVEPALPVLLDQLPRLREGRRGMMDFGVEMVVGRVTLRLLRRIEDESEREAIVRRVFPQIEQLSGRMELIDTVGHLENAGHKLVSESESTRLYEHLVNDIKTASSDVLSNERQLVRLFVRVAQADGDAGPTYIAEACSDDAVFLRLLRAGLGERRRQTMGDYAVRAQPSLPWELYAEWLGAERLAARAVEVGASVDRSQLDDRTQSALDTAEKYVAGDLSHEDDDF
jgi:predicted KAP-like P-loop ATPase